MSARVILFPGPLSSQAAVRHWQARGEAAREERGRLLERLLVLDAEIDRCASLARLAEKDPPCPEPRANETPGSPTTTEGDPLEPA